MLRKLLLLIVFVGLTCNTIAQSLRGTVTEAGTGETIPMANVVVKSGQTIVQGGATDFDGKYVISPLSPGTYNVEISFVGYATQNFSGVTISPSKSTQLDVKLSEGGEMIEEAVLEYRAPIIDPDHKGDIVSKADIAAKPIRGVGALAANTGGVAQVDQGASLSVRGGRSEQTVYFVDGVKVLGTPNISNSAMDQIQVITGGVPAEYGDVTSGVISIVTRGPGSEIFGGIELQTSNYLDAYDYNLGEFYFSTPLLWKDDKKQQALLGVFLSGNVTYVKDQSYSRFGYKLKDNVIKELEESPLILSRNSDGISSVYALNYATADNFESLDYALNNTNRTYSLQSKFNLQTSETSSLKFGGTYSYTNSEGGNASVLRLFNTVGGTHIKSSNMRVYADYTQFFKNAEEGEKSTIENASYNIHADYSIQTQFAGDRKHQEDYWRYGYVGMFTPEYSKSGLRSFTQGDRISFYNNVTGEQEEQIIAFNSSTGNVNYAFDNNFDVEHYGFNATTINEGRANYTSQYYDYATYEEETDLNQMTSAGALINGSNTNNIYSLWTSPGQQVAGASKFERNQFRLTGSAGGKLGNHEIKAGFEYEQRTRRFWSINTNQLWLQGRLLENRHLIQASEFNYEYNGGVNADNQLVLTAIPVVDEASITGYAANIRELTGTALTAPVSTDATFINDLSVNLFSEEELATNGIVSGYYGYDVYGNEITGSQPDVNDFLTDSLSNGVLKREIGAFQPIYMAGYIQDKFFVKDLVFNVGVRVDRYDANQQVLKDKYSIYDIKTAGEVDLSVLSNTQYTIPTNIGDGYAVYVNDAENPTAITGYRNEDTWYNAEGVIITDPTLIANGSGRATPYLDDNAKNGLDKNNGFNDNGFTDYTPEITVMPRVSFNFPITEEALFFAHYDVLTQRPTPGQSRLNPNYYLQMAIGNRAGTGSNPDLKPQRNTDYELGFKQALSENSALEISLFYREMRDMIQLQQVTQAYPSNYTQYSNRDFGTVKGLTLKYNMRKVKNFSFDVNYTLQFADGTGSNSASAQNLINFGQPDLRTTLPLSFDQRHQLTANALYSYGRGSRYDGPKSLAKILEGTSIALSAVAASGRPYTKHSEVTSQVTTGLNASAPIEGSINGARLPFNFRFDLKLTKSFDVKLTKKKTNPMSVYVQVNNLLDTENILRVYGFTGNSDDDGYLSSAVGQTVAQNQINQDTYELLYGYKVDNPVNLSRPRTIRLGLTLGF